MATALVCRNTENGGRSTKLPCTYDSSDGLMMMMILLVLLLMTRHWDLICTRKSVALRWCRRRGGSRFIVVIVLIVVVVEQISCFTTLGRQLYGPARHLGASINSSAFKRWFSVTVIRSYCTIVTRDNYLSHPFNTQQIIMTI